jgi:hypothetical protein
MSETYAVPALASYRDAVTDLMEAGEPFGEVEDAINDVPDLDEDAKAALWLLAFSMRDTGAQRQDAHAYLSLVGQADPQAYG